MHKTELIGKLKSLALGNDPQKSIKSIVLVVNFARANDGDINYWIDKCTASPSIPPAANSGSERPSPTVAELNKNAKVEPIPVPSVEPTKKLSLAERIALANKEKQK